MGWLKNVGKGIKKGVDKVVRPIRPKPNPPPRVPGLKPANPILDKLEDVGDVADKLTDTVKDRVEDAGDAVKNTAKKVGKAVKPVSDAVGKVLEPVADAIDEVEHFARTGDLGHQVVELQEEEGEAKVDLKEAQTIYLETASRVISAFARLRGLSVVHEGGDGMKIADPKDVQVEEVDVDLYGNSATRLLDRIGLDEVANGIRTLRKFTFMMPQEILFKQIELAEHRKALRANIRDLKDARASVRKSTKGLEKHLAKLEREIARLEKQLAEAGIAADGAAGMELRVKEVEQAAKQEIARAMLSDGLPDEIVIELTGLDAESILAIRAENHKDA